MVLVVGGEGTGMIEESGQEEGWQQVFFFSVRKRLSGVAVGVEVLHGPCRGGGGQRRCRPNARMAQQEVPAWHSGM